MEPLSQSNAGQHLGGDSPGIPAVGQLQGQHDVFQRSEVAQQLEALKDKTYFLGAKVGAGVFAQGKNILTGQTHRTLRWRIKPCNDRQQGTFARARCTDNGDCFPRVQFEVNIAQNGQGAGGIGDRLENMLNGNN